MNTMFGFVRTLLRNVTQKPATVLDPNSPENKPKTIRGHIEIAIDDCIFCGMCDRKCPTKAIKVLKPKNTWSIERLRCIQCSSCVDNCPKKCLFMHEMYTTPMTSRRTDTFVKEVDPVEEARLAAEKAAKIEAAKAAAAARAAATATGTAPQA